MPEGNGFVNPDTEAANGETIIKSLPLIGKLVSAVTTGNLPITGKFTYIPSL
jgi:hypothetical protein